VSDLLDQPGGFQALQVPYRLVTAQSLVTGVRRPACALRASRGVERSDRPLAQPGRGDLIGQGSPDLGRQVKPPLDKLRTQMVRTQAEPHPAVGIPLRLEASALRLGQRRVVKGRVVRRGSEPFLDAGELGGQDQLAREHQCLQAARHAAVAIAPRMDADQVQVRHCRAHNGRGVAVAVLKPGAELVHQLGNLGRVRSGVDGRVVRRAGDPDRAEAVSARRSVEFAAQHHEMQRRQQHGVIAEHLEPRRLEHIGQCIRITRDSVLGMPVVPIRHLLTGHDRLRVGDLDCVTLDPVRAPDRPRYQAPPQLPQPTPRLAYLMTQIYAEPFKLRQDPLIGRVDLRRPKQHATMLHAS